MYLLQLYVTNDWTKKNDQLKILEIDLYGYNTAALINNKSLIALLSSPHSTLSFSFPKAIKHDFIRCS